MEHAQWVGQKTARFHQFVAQLGAAVGLDQRDDAARLPCGRLVRLELLVLAAPASTRPGPVKEGCRVTRIYFNAVFAPVPAPERDVGPVVAVLVWDVFQGLKLRPISTTMVIRQKETL